MTVIFDHQVPREPAPGDDPIPDQQPSPDDDPVPDHNPVTHSHKRPPNGDAST